VHAALPWSSPVLVACHSCVLSWWSAVKGGAAPEDTWHRYREYVSQGVCSADHLVAPTVFMRDAIRSHYDVRRKPFTVIPNGRTPLPFCGRRKEPFILCAGRLWDEAKNIDALHRISSASPWPIYAAGEEQGASGCSRAASGDSHFHRLGQLSTGDLAGWMSRAAIYCLPARYEPFGLSVLEAAFCDCALLLSDIPSLRENWEGAALFVPLDDDDALVRSIRRLAGDPNLRAQLAQRARQRAQGFTPERMAKGYLRLYRELLLAGYCQRDPTQGNMACAS
jgi:glycogen synthase